jgi:hypothetical protein
MESLSDFGFEAAGPGQAPAAHGFKEGEQTGNHEYQPHNQLEIYNDNAGDQAQTSDHPAGDPSAMVNVGPEKSLHTRNLPRLKALSNSSFNLEPGGGSAYFRGR